MFFDSLKRLKRAAHPHHSVMSILIIDNHSSKLMGSLSLLDPSRQCRSSTVYVWWDFSDISAVTREVYQNVFELSYSPWGLPGTSAELPGCTVNVCQGNKSG